MEFVFESLLTNQFMHLIYQLMQQQKWQPIISPECLAMRGVSTDGKYEILLAIKSDVRWIVKRTGAHTLTVTPEPLITDAEGKKLIEFINSLTEHTFTQLLYRGGFV